MKNSGNALVTGLIAVAVVVIIVIIIATGNKKDATAPEVTNDTTMGEMAPAPAEMPAAPATPAPAAPATPAAQ